MIRQSRASRAENPETKTVKWIQLRLSLAPLVSSCFMHVEKTEDYLNKTKQNKGILWEKKRLGIMSSKCSKFSCCLHI
jgi:hypothetical protein